MNRPVDALEHFLYAILVAKCDIIQSDLVEVFQLLSLFFIRQFCQLQQTLGGRCDAIHFRSDAHRVCDRPLYAADQLDHGCQGPVSQVPVINIDAAPDHAEQPGEVENQSHAAVHAEAEDPLPHLLCGKRLLLLGDPSGRAFF